jgi:hypothetical protein
MTAEEVIDFFAPHENSADAVLKWLEQSGISGDRVAVSVNKQVRIWELFFSDSGSRATCKQTSSERQERDQNCYANILVVGSIRRNRFRSRRATRSRLPRLATYLRKA